MGWDAHATHLNKKHVGLIWHRKSDTYIISNHKLRVAFKNASRKVKRKTGTVDGFLAIGGLDCSACALALENAMGMNCWGNGYSPTEVKEFYKSAWWEDAHEEDPKHQWAVESAKAFLSVCVRHGLGITFSW